MSYENWKNKAQGFQTVDVRHIQGSFFEVLQNRDRKSTRLNSSHEWISRMPSSA